MQPEGTKSAASRWKISAARDLQAIYGGVFAVHIVADFGGGHRGTHRGRGACDSVAAQIHDGVFLRLVRRVRCARSAPLSSVKFHEYFIRNGQMRSARGATARRSISSRPCSRRAAMRALQADADTFFDAGEVNASSWRKPRNNSSSSACCAVTGSICSRGETPLSMHATYFAESCMFDQRRCAIEGMRASAEADVRFAAPILQIVARAEARQTPIRDFVVFVSGFCEASAGGFVGLGHGVVAGNGFGAIAAAARERFFSEAAAFINFQQINRNVFRANLQNALDRFFPRCAASAARGRQSGPC